MAYGCADFGIVLGVLFLMLAGGITWLSLRVLARMAIDFQGSDPTFYSVSEAILPKAKWVIDVGIVLNCFGGCIAFVQIIGRLMSQGLMDMINWNEDDISTSSVSLIIQASVLVALAPLCVTRQITSTKIANLVGLFCIGYIFLITFVYSPCTAISTELLEPASIITLFAAFPTFIFAYACQQNIFSIATEMKDVSMKKLTMISSASVLTGFIVYLPLMLLPYMTFGANIKSSFLYNLDSTKVPVMIAFVLASISVSISYVLLLQPIRGSLMSLIFGKNQPTGKREETIRISGTIALMLLSWGLAIVLGENLGLPINLAGLFGGNTMCFVMPFALYLKKYGFDRKNAFSVIVLVTFIFCILLYPICFTGIIYKQVA